MERKETAAQLPRRKYLRELLALSDGKTALTYKLLPSTRDFIGANAGVGRLSFRYVVGEDRSRVELYIDRADAETNDRIFDELLSHKSEIEAAFGERLSWERLEDSISSRVAYRIVSGGSGDAENTWLATQTALVDAMVRLENALLPYIHGLGRLIY
jgi:hypothetical protein